MKFSRLQNPLRTSKLISSLLLFSDGAYYDGWRPDFSGRDRLLRTRVRLLRMSFPFVNGHFSCSESPLEATQVFYALVFYFE